MKRIYQAGRPPGVGWQRPLERSARPGAAACRKSKVEEQHDKWVAIFEREELEQMLTDLESRSIRWANAPVNGWATERCAAIRRRLEILKKAKP